MDLIHLQNTIRNTACPHCGETGHLEAILKCDWDEGGCSPAGLCNSCGTHVLLEVSESATSQPKIHVVCDPGKSICNVVGY